MTQKIKIEIGATTGYVGATIEEVIEFEKEWWYDEVGEDDE